MAVLKNRAKMSTSTTGTGTITLGSAEDGYQTFADAGVANADVVRYIIEDGNNFEIGTGTYTSSGTTLSRTVSESSNSNNAINLSGSATVFIGATAEDIPALYAENASLSAIAPIATGNDSVSLGSDANSSGTDSIAIMNGNASGLNSLAAVILNNTTTYGAQGSGSISIGTLSKATAIAGTAVGYAATSTHSAASAFGTSATTTASNQIALGGSGITARISGAYNLPTSDGTNGQVLTTNGSGAITFADAGGGGDPDLYRDNASSPTTPLAGGANGVAIGSGSNAGGSGAIALGVGSAAGDGAFCAINGGGNTSYGAVGNRSIAMGEAARASASDAVAIGENAYAQGAESFSIGTQTDAIGTRAGAFAYNALAQGNYSMAFGNAGAFGTESFAAAIANNTNTYGATGANSIALGDRSKASGSRGIAISGFGALASGAQSLAFGYQATATQGYGSGFGYASKAYGAYSWAGTESHASGHQSTALGLGDTSTSYGALHSNSMALGYQATTSAAKQIALGSSTAQVKVSGAYTLPTADGTNGQVLTTDGSGAVTFADAGGGGGDPDLYRDNASSATTPTASGTNAVAIGTNAIASNTESVALGGDTLSSGYKSFGAIIGNSFSAYGASGFAAISIGLQSRSTNSGGVAIGSSAYSSGSSSLALGSASTASGTKSIAIGDSTANAYLATSFGEYALSESQGKYSYASGRFGSTEGSAQQGTYVLRADTTDATPEGLTTRNNGGVQSDNQVNLPNNSAYAFTGTIVARESAGSGTECAAWKVEGLIRREGSAGTTVLVNSATTVLNNAPNWGMALSADTTNGALAITVTGAAKTIRWVGTITTSELIHA